jgi:putative endonuclease
MPAHMFGSAVYIITNERNGTLYIGVTSDLGKRISEHKLEIHDGFSKKYGLKILVWYEVHDDIREAIRREKQIKKWERKWKLRLIEEDNPQWKDLYETL